MASKYISRCHYSCILFQDTILLGQKRVARTSCRCLRPQYPFPEACYAGAYGGQVSLVCVCGMPSPLASCPEIIQYTTTITTTMSTVAISSSLILSDLVMPTDKEEQTAVITTLEGTIKALVEATLDPSQSVAEVRIISVGEVPVNQGRRMLTTTNIDFKCIMEE